MVCRSVGLCVMSVTVHRLSVFVYVIGCGSLRELLWRKCVGCVRCREETGVCVAQRWARGWMARRALGRRRVIARVVRAACTAAMHVAYRHGTEELQGSVQLGIQLVRDRPGYTGKQQHGTNRVAVHLQRHARGWLARRTAEASRISCLVANAASARCSAMY